MTNDNKIKPDILNEYPFLSFITYGGNEYLGIVQNLDEHITCFYHFDSLTTDEQKRRFLQLGEQWWWESNRLIPINVFLREDWVVFRSCLKTFNSKDVTLEFGPYVSLKEIAQKRSKRRSITLIRKVD